MYPPDFGFRERWFWPCALAHQLRARCKSVRVRFIPKAEGRHRGCTGFCRFYRWMWHGSESSKCYMATNHSTKMWASDLLNFKPGDRAH